MCVSDAFRIYSINMSLEEALVVVVPTIVALGVPMVAQYVGNQAKARFGLGPTISKVIDGITSNATIGYASMLYNMDKIRHTTLREITSTSGTLASQTAFFCVAYYALQGVAMINASRVINRTRERILIDDVVVEQTNTRNKMVRSNYGLRSSVGMLHLMVLANRRRP